MSESERLMDAFAHDRWASAKLFQLALNSKVDKVGVLVSHILCAQHIWLFRIERAEPEMNAFDIIESSQWLGLLGRHLDRMHALASADLQRGVTYSNSRGDQYENTLGDILWHLSLHSQYHRGQIAQLLKSEGFDIPGTDYIFYKRQ